MLFSLSAEARGYNNTFVDRGILVMCTCLYHLYQGEVIKIIRILSKIYLKRKTKKTAWISACVELSLIDGGLYAAAGFHVKNIYPIEWHRGKA